MSNDNNSIQNFIRNLRITVDILNVSLSDIIKNKRISGYKITGKLENTEDLLCTLIHFGDDNMLNSWKAKLFSEIEQEESLSNISLFKVLFKKNYLDAADITIFPVNPLTKPFFTRNNWHIIPKKVFCHIDLQQPIKQLLSSRDVKNEIRVIKKQTYEFRELRTDEAFEEFYNEMLVPTVTNRHQKSGFLSGLENLKKTFKNGYLLAAYQGSEWIAANLIIPEDDGTLVSANVGWRGGSVELLKNRIVSVLIYELIKRGQEQGFKVLDLGSNNPFAKDGPLNYKLKWNADIISPKITYEDGVVQGTRSYMSVKFDTNSTAAQHVLKNEPIFSKEKENLQVIGWNSKIPSSFKHQVDKGLKWINLDT